MFLGNDRFWVSIRLLLSLLRSSRGEGIWNISLKGAFSSLFSTVIICSFPLLETLEELPAGFLLAFDSFVLFVPLFVDLFPLYVCCSSVWNADFDVVEAFYASLMYATVYIHQIHPLQHALS